jgi:hypothetical protein
MWQDVATFLVVLSAALYLAYRFVPRPGRKPSVGCGSCPLHSSQAPGACHDKPVVINLSSTLSPLPTQRPRTGGPGPSGL